MKQTIAENRNVKENEAFFDRWARSYDRPLFQFGMRRFYQPALRQIAKRGKVLDVSCGAGGLLRELQRRVSDGKKGYALYGADISSGMLAAARRKLGKSVHLQKADVHRLLFKDNQFDYVISTEAFSGSRLAAAHAAAELSVRGAEAGSENGGGKVKMATKKVERTPLKISGMRSEEH